MSPNPTKRTEPQLYAAGGDYARMRFKWTCPQRGCGKRNDSKVVPPLGAHESFSCAHCHRATGFTVTPAAKKDEATS
jgi:hypothetical protein